MRIALTLIFASSEKVLPINYQYEFSAWVYKMIHFGNSDFASWLHNKGYGQNGKFFKLFTFSNIEAERYKVIEDRYKILSDDARLILTFHVDEAVQHFITGLFQNNTFSIGDRKSRVDFEVKSVEAAQPPVFVDKMRFKTLSPVCVSRRVELNGNLHTEYLAPEHPEYEQRFFENLFMRYAAVNGLEESSGVIKNCRLKLTSKAKSRLIKIKADTPQETRIRGYLYDFECQAPAALLKFGYEAGFGEKNALGFGCVELNS